MKFICLGYLDPSAWTELSESEVESTMQACFDYDDVLRQGGHFLGGEALGDPGGSVTVRWQDGKVQVVDGPFIESKEVLGGILILEAKDKAHAIELMSKHPGVQVGPFEIREADAMVEKMIQARAEKMDEQIIRTMVENWRRAVENKDLDGICAHYTEDTVLYDAIPPYKTVGKAAIRASWAACLPFFPDNFRCEHRDLTFSIDQNTAFVFGLHHFVTEDLNHPAGQTWMRISIGFEKQQGVWQVVHEHVSIPFNPMNNEAWNIKDPNILDAPDYSAAGE